MSYITKYSITSEPPQHTTRPTGEGVNLNGQALPERRAARARDAHIRAPTPLHIPGGTRVGPKIRSGETRAADAARTEQRGPRRRHVPCASTRKLRMATKHSLLYYCTGYSCTVVCTAVKLYLDTGRTRRGGGLHTPVRNSVDQVQAQLQVMPCRDFTSGVAPDTTLG